MHSTIYSDALHSTSLKEAAHGALINLSLLQLSPTPRAANGRRSLIDLRDLLARYATARYYAVLSMNLLCKINQLFSQDLIAHNYRANYHYKSRVANDKPSFLSN